MNSSTVNTFAPAGEKTEARTGQPPKQAVRPAKTAPASGNAPGTPRPAGLQKSLLGLMTGIAAVSVLGNVLMYYRFTTLRPLVTVGNHVITKREYLAVLDDDAGKPTLNKLVFTELIRQAAAKAGVTPTDKDVDARLAELQAKNPKMFEAVPPWKLRAAAQSDLALENLRIQGVNVTDAEVARYYAAHQAAFTQQGQLQAALIVTDNNTDAQTALHLFQQNIDPSIIAKQPDFHLVGTNGYTVDLQRPDRRNIVKAIFAMKTGGEQTFPLDKQFLTVRVYVSQGAHVVPFAQARPLAARLAKLDKAPSAKAEMASLYKANTPVFDIDKYSAFFDDVQKDISSPAPANH